MCVVAGPQTSNNNYFKKDISVGWRIMAGPSIVFENRSCVLINFTNHVKDSVNFQL